jgi:hypothetical protein
MTQVLRSLGRLVPLVLGWLNWVELSYLIGIAVVAMAIAVGLPLIR